MRIEIHRRLTPIRVAVCLGASLVLLAGCPGTNPTGNTNGNTGTNTNGNANTNTNTNTNTNDNTNNNSDPPPAQGDADGDGVADSTDNCVDDSNATQEDTDGDGVGDVCDACVNDADNDADGDGVCGDVDNCPGTPNADQADANADGIGDACEGDQDSDGTPDDTDNCPTVSNADQADTDTDGLGDACDACPNDADNDADGDGVCGDLDACLNTPRGDPVGADGCPPSSPPPPPPPPPPAGCGNGIVETGEACDDAGASATCNANCTVSVCGDNNLNTAAGEECDDGNTTPADGCGATCLIETPPSNDNCTAPITVTDGETAFVNIAATTDGADVPVTCSASAYGDTQIGADVWFVYTATCDGELVVSLCGSSYDTKVAVYAGATCPTQLPDACDDDGCGGGGLDSRVTLAVITGQDYVIRAGGFDSAQGDGTLTIRCGVDTCAAGAGACSTANGTPGCDDATCCQTTCAVDAFCCDVDWDNFCAGEAQGLCSGSFTACAAGSGTCSAGNTTGGCDSVDCCNSVCMIDPFCCVDTWDNLCADQAAATCGLTCGPGQGSCFLPNGSSGCDNQSCCLTVCANDPFCCQTEWDADCASAAAQTCR